MSYLADRAWSGFPACAQKSSGPDHLGDIRYEHPDRYHHQADDWAIPVQCVSGKS